MIKVSVIVPIYNVEKQLAKCLDSLLNQTLKDIQIILVNDGSEDSSAEIAKKYVVKDPDRVLYFEKANGGLSDARNYGIPYATGEYIAFLDSDDYVELDTYENMYNLAKKENSDMVECNFIWEYPQKIKIDIGKKYSGKHEMIEKIRVVAWNKLIKRQVIEKSKIQFPKGYRYEDVEFTYKLIPYLENISFLEEPCIHYIQRQNSISNMQNERTKEIFVVLNNVIKYYKELEIYEEYKDELEYVYTRYLLCSSLLRMVKIKEKKTRKEILNLTWENLNKNFPKWKKNKILNKNKSMKDKYIKSVNKFTYKIYCFIFRSI